MFNLVRSDQQTSISHGTCLRFAHYIFPGTNESRDDDILIVHIAIVKFRDHAFQALNVKGRLLPMRFKGTKGYILSASAKK